MTGGYMRDVRGTRLDGVAIPSAKLDAQAAPSAPTSIMALAIAAGTAAVAWQAPHSSRGQALTYTVTASTGQTATVTSSTVPNQTTVTGLTNGTATTFTVVAANSVGTSPASAPSNPVTPTVDPLGLTIPGLAWCLDADQITGVTNGGTVSSWPDSSGNGNPATSSANQPTLLTGWANGKSALVFGSATVMSSLFNTALLPGRCTAFIVFDVATANSDSRVLSNEVNNARRDSGNGWEIDTNGGVIRAIICGVNASPTTTWTAATPQLATITSPGLAYLNGQAPSAKPVMGSNATPNPFWLGSVTGTAKRHLGRIAHVRFYNRVLSATERHAVEAALATKYGLTVGVN